MRAITSSKVIIKLIKFSLKLFFKNNFKLNIAIKIDARRIHRIYKSILRGL